MSLRDVFCQDRAIGILQRGLAVDRPAHAYIFAGPEGVGKYKTAREWAKLLLCQKPDTKKDKSGAFADSCGSCEACTLLEAGLDVLVEKPMAADLASARRLIQAAQAGSRILQVGHLERFNPAVMALKRSTRLPLFFEVHRLSVFTPRSLDIDVVLDLMIHDLDIVLNLVGQLPQEIRAAGISVLSPRVDIANVRLAFPGGCVANLTASRVSTERVRKLRMFQPGQYVSLDYSRQDAVVFQVGEGRQIASGLLTVEKAEPLSRELESFLDAVETRSQPLVTGADACRALEVALAILAKIEEHSRLIAQSLTAWES